MNFPFDSKAFSIFHNIFAFFGTLDFDGVVTTIDGGIFEKLKSRRELLIGQKFSDINYWQSSRYNLEKLEIAIADAAVKNVKTTFDFGLNDKEKICVELFLQPVFGKEQTPEYIFFGAQDLSNHENDNKRKIVGGKFSDSAAAKIPEREKKIGSEAEEANRAKESFIAVISHELRSPLNTILGWTKILLTREVNETARKNALETIEKSARSQAKLIDDLVDSARISSNKLQLEHRRINLFEILKAVYNSQKPIIEAKNVNLEFTSDNENIRISGDAARLQQIFTYLISNALKSTKPSENITIGVQNGEDEVKVFVRDDGRGISPEMLPGIFRQFQQDGEKTSINRAGLGLELSLVKILVEKHNGKVYAESKGVGCGSTFTVVLPLSKKDEKITSASEPAEQKIERLLSGIDILVVEDDPDSREVLRLFLEQSGANVKSAESAFDAVRLLKKTMGNLPDMIISDLAMPVEDGFSLITRIRSLSTEQGGDIPAIALSAFASSNNKKQAYEAGFQKYHTKPFEPDGLIGDILTLIKK